MIVIRRAEYAAAPMRGWRAWLFHAVALLAVTLFFVVLISLLLGLALTVVTFLIFGAPLALALALILRAFGQRGRRRGPPIIDHEPLPPR